MTIGDTLPADAQSVHQDGDDDAAELAPRRYRFASAWRAALDVVLPPLCLGCQARLTDHDALCPACWRQVDFIRPPLCDRLGLPMPYDVGGQMISGAAAADPPPYDRARAVARYDGQMRDLIHGFKFHDTHDARRLFGNWLVQAGRELTETADVIVPVPLARFRLLSRRFNQAQILAAEIGQRTKLPVASLVLIRSRATVRQIGLTRGERRKNVSGAFSVRPRAISQIAGKSVLLVDDVITTGATVSAAAKALLKAGAARVDVLALGLVTDPGG